MKVKFIPIVLLFSMICLWLPTASADAQDKGLSPNELLDPNHSELNLNEDKILLTEHESKPTLPARDSAMVHSKPTLVTTPVTKSKTAEHKPSTAKEEDDALSFNFLYYIIQKFKISDLVDE